MTQPPEFAAALDLPTRLHGQAFLAEHHWTLVNFDFGAPQIGHFSGG